MTGFTGFNNGTLMAANVDFRQTKPVAPQMIADGQLLIGAAVAPFIRAGHLTSTGATITITEGAGTINLEAAGGGSGITALTDPFSNSTSGSSIEFKGTSPITLQDSGALFNATANDMSLSFDHITLSDFNTLGSFSGGIYIDSAIFGIQNILAFNGNGSCTYLGYTSGPQAPLIIGNTGCTIAGFQAAQFIDGADSICAFGQGAFASMINGTNHIAIGVNVAINQTGGTDSIIIGAASGSQYGSTESSNIIISNIGVVSENNTIRIGTTGTGTAQQSRCFLAGVNGVTVTGTAVLCSTAGQLGTIASSERYKENILPIDANVSVLNLRPSQFNYKADETKSPQYGLIAEQVEKDFPYLCFYNDQNQPESVKYHELPTLLLAEIQRLNQRLITLEKKCL